MIHASNLCFLFLHCQWLMRGNYKSLQREALLEGERRIREDVSKVGFTVQRFFVPLLVCSWLSKVASSQSLIGSPKVRPCWGLSIPVTPWPLLRTSQEWQLSCALSSTESSHRPDFQMSSLVWGRSRTFWCSLKMVSAKSPGHSSP